MKFLVTVKKVADYEARLKTSSDNKFINLEDVNMITNPFDEIGVEAALQLKETFGGEVIVVSVGSESCQQNIRTALAMGADKGILVKYDKVDEFINTEFIVNILENICKQENPDIIIMGKQAIDTDNHQTAEYLSEKLNIGNASQANSIDIDKEKNIAIVKKEVDGGLETISLALPCIITTDLRLNEPRYASLPGIMKAKRKPLKLIDLSSLQLNTNSNFEILSVNTPTKRKVGSIVKTTDELIEKLHSEIKTI